MKRAQLLLAAHLLALGFGLAGLLIALPNPDLWASDPNAVKVFNFGMTYAGSLHIILGALAMFAFGVYAIGWWRTGVFFALSVPISLGAELLGTGTGWPFGNYSYTSFLGYKIAGHVPFSIPLSWFYVGFASLLLGTAIARRFELRPRSLWSVGLGVWFLTVWDLVLDPAMAHESLPVKFWEWHQTGPYFGMPVLNFIGWSATGLVFMSLSRWLWRADANRIGPASDLWFPFAIYGVNTLFAMVLSASVGLWIPIVLAAILGLGPASLAWRARPSGPGQRTEARTWRPLPSR